MRIGDLFFGIKGDWNEFEGELSKRGAKAGDKLGKEVGRGFNVGKVAVGLFATAAAGAFAVAAKGAADLERIQGDYAAATGASTEEAKAFAAQVNGMRGSNTQSLQAIAAAGTQVAQQFKVTGDEAKGLTQDFLLFSRVTKQDAAGAVDSFDQALDAFGEPASRATSLMDQLVVSNQKYGTVAGPAALSALQGMAPALKALGGGLDEGVGLLNLFEAAGMDASAAQRGLNTAVKNLPPGTTLDDVIARLGAIEDPALRAQEAIKIFGGRSGVGLANAIKPGMKSLDEFEVSIGDAAGATDKAADSMLTTSDKFGMFFESLKSKAAGIGQDFGPLLMGVASIGTLVAPMAKSIGSLFLGLARHAGILGAAAAAGAAQGTAMAGGEAAGGLLGSFKTALGGKLGLILKSAGVLGLAAAAPTIQAEAQKLGASVNEGIFGNQAANDAKGGALGGTFFDSFLDRVHDAANAASDFYIWPPGGPPKAAEQGAVVGAAFAGAMVGGINTGMATGDADAGFAGVTSTMVPRAEQLGRDTTGAVARGIAGNTGAVSGAAQDVGEAALWRLRAVPGFVQAGTGKAGEVATGIDAGTGRVTGAIGGVMGAAQRSLDRVDLDAGAPTVRPVSGLPGVISAAQYWLNRNRLSVGVDTYSGNTRYGDRHRAHGGPVDANGVYIVGENGPETLVMNSRGGYVIPHDRSYSAADTGAWLGAERSGTPAASVSSIQVNVHTPFPLSPGMGQALAREIVPHIETERRRQRL